MLFGEGSMDDSIIRFDAGSCDIAVIGAGHAGIEASLAAARLGLDAICFSSLLSIRRFSLVSMYNTLYI